jgi:hypothetical protein
MPARGSLRDTAHGVSQENVEIVRNAIHAFLESDFEGWFAVTDPGWVVVELEEIGVAESGLRVEQRFAHAIRIEDGKGVEWRMFGPVEEAFEALGLSERDAHSDAS